MTFNLISPRTLAIALTIAALGGVPAFAQDAMAPAMAPAGEMSTDEAFLAECLARAALAADAMAADTLAESCHALVHSDDAMGMGDDAMGMEGDTMAPQ